MVCRIVNEQEHREGVEPSSPHYESGIFATGLSVPSIASVGPEGLEPSLGGLRARCAAVDHDVHGARLDPVFSVPYAQGVGAEGVEPSV